MNSDKVSGIVRYYCIPGCQPLSRGTPRSAGFDVGVRALVSKERDGYAPHQRRIIYDFGWAPKETSYIYHNPIKDRFEYILKRDHVVVVGLGVVLGMEPGWSAFVTRRSSTALDDVVLPDQVAEMMFGVPIDNDFRGEPIARLRNLGDDFSIWKGQKVLQLLFFDGEGKGPVTPHLQQVSDVKELGVTDRGCRAHASTGH